MLDGKANVARPAKEPLDRADAIPTFAGRGGTLRAAQRNYTPGQMARPTSTMPTSETAHESVRRYGIPKP